MRVAVLADIHGNLSALRATLADLRRRDVDRIIVNGDLVNRGPDSAAVMHELLALDGVTFILGNHDDLLRLWQERSDNLPSDWFTDPFWEATAWNAEQLDRGGLLYVPQDWALTETLHAPGLPDVQVAHGTPDNYREGVSDRTSAERLREVAGLHGVIVGSHIHRPVIHRSGDTLVLNTGGVGVSSDGDPRAAYLLLTATPQGWQPEIIRVDYDRALSLRRFSESGYLATGLSAEVFRQELLTSRSLYTPYWAWTEAQKLPRTDDTWNRFIVQHS
ncbi:metallophosphoesterase family protein [Deinococcus radiophilus]|uniref:Metallophosphoesterase n=1 Tax=Deinococcus radiophilus TaxID=32062 RepID=A0A431VYV1_9DEIO|nr:metallophosphoesterase family protein [Deinococcus radiophilus]RTR28333.1 metallophosphoesterase [Deinococcus radiophilus]UFA51200.1 metallophosphatase family protein [Deinococcus radiophilus]